MLKNGEHQTISDLKVGDSILAMDSNGEYTFSPVISFLHRAPEDSGLFNVIQTDTGHTVTLTPHHLIYRKGQSDDEKQPEGYTSKGEVEVQIISANEKKKNQIASPEIVFAADIQEGDSVFVFDATNKMGLLPAKVTKVEARNFSGLYAPLTADGNLVVDNVLASCYAVTDSHTLAHLAFVPLRLWYNLLDIYAYLTGSENVRSMDGTGSADLDGKGIHWYAKGLYSFVESTMPSRIHKKLQI